MLDGLLDDFALDGPPGSGQGSSRRGEGEKSPRLPGEPAAPRAARLQRPGGCRRGWGAPGLTTRHWQSTGCKFWGQRSWCHPPNHPPPPGRDKDPVRGEAAPQPGARGLHSQLSSFPTRCRQPGPALPRPGTSAWWHSECPRGDTGLCFPPVFWPGGRAVLEPQQGNPAPQGINGGGDSPGLTSEVAVVAQVAAHEAVIGLGDHLGRAAGSGPA